MLSNTLQEGKSILKATEFNEFQTLKDRWNDSLSKSLNNDVFSTWEWLSTWWKHFGEGKRLVILLIEDKNKTLAIAPFMYSKHSFLSFGNLKKISFVGSPESDYTGFILREKKRKFLELFFDYLNGHIDWDYLELKDIPETSASADLLRRIPLEKQYEHWDERVCNLCPYVLLPSSMDVFMKELGRSMRRNLRRYLRKLKKEYRVELKKYNEIGSVKEAMETFIRLHQKRWKSKGEPGGFNNPFFRNFHIDVAKCFAEKGWLGLYFLTANDEPISAEYNFEYNEKNYNYLPGWDVEYSQYRVGQLIQMHIIEDCIQKGLKEYDMMRGDEPYKSEWTTLARKNLEVRFVRKGTFPRIYNWLIKKAAFDNLTLKLRLSLKLCTHNEK
jgi:CelD/BcsL family acetyltransferase involved in cellulose biosynthesis